jgi:hypothetical protein
VGAYVVSLEGFSAGQAVVNVMGAKGSGETQFETAVEALQCAVALARSWEQNVMGRLCNTYQFVGATARGAFEGEISAFEPAIVTAGGSASEPMPTFVAIKWRLRTATPGARGRGRTGLSPVPENTTDAANSNAINAVNRNAYQANADAFLAQIAAAAPAVQLAVISRVLNGVPRAIPLVSPVTSISVDSRLGTRVSRLR